MSIYCNNCGTELDDNSKYCYRCGDELINPSKVPITDSSKECPICGSCSWRTEEETILVPGKIVSKTKIHLFNPFVPLVTTKERVVRPDRYEVNRYHVCKNCGFCPEARNQLTRKVIGFVVIVIIFLIACAYE